MFCQVTIILTVPFHTSVKGLKTVLLVQLSIGPIETIGMLTNCFHHCLQWQSENADMRAVFKHWSFDATDDAD